MMNEEEEGEGFDEPSTSNAVSSTSADQSFSLLHKKKRPDDEKYHVYAIVRNIPGWFHSKDLRRFFSGFVETARFDCFHFRHRPEIHQQQQQSNDKDSTDAVTDKSTKLSDPSDKKKDAKNKRFCCVVRLKCKADRDLLISDYHQKHWITEDGSEIALKCFIFSLKLSEGGSDKGAPSNSLSTTDAEEMIELRPPLVMPQGNVGTPSRYFFEQIRNCALPTSVIAKLGLKPLRSQRQFGAVPMEYASTSRRYASIEEKVIAQSTPDNDDGEDDDKDECEEWERHEALHDDVTEQDRTKQKLYEDDAEVTWEKGGPGLVWYTDSFYWDQAEGTDCDWRWADDWDVDFSVYYDKDGGDMDARQAVQIRREKMLRSGAEDSSVFKSTNVKPTAIGRKRRRSESDVDTCGRFERHTKGIGAKLLRRFGWKPGTGVGKGVAGRPYPIAVDLETEAQLSNERRGFGYRGEKLQRTGFVRPPPKHSINTVYDDKTVLPEDQPAPLLRRDVLTRMKYR
uniref:G-patch domain-containing protein n=1 Tax=Plectus sambesii TaxID=2011161 RepID=A0A914W9D6_9BILA